MGENKLSLQVLVSRKSVRMPILTKNRVKMTETHKESGEDDRYSKLKNRLKLRQFRESTN